MFDAQTLLEVTVYPHLADNIAVLREVRRRDELDQEPGCCRDISEMLAGEGYGNVLRAITTATITENQKIL